MCRKMGGSHLCRIGSAEYEIVELGVHLHQIVEVCAGYAAPANLRHRLAFGVLKQEVFSEICSEDGWISICGSRGVAMPFCT